MPGAAGAPEHGAAESRTTCECGAPEHGAAGAPEHGAGSVTGVQ